MLVHQRVKQLELGSGFEMPNFNLCTRQVWRHNDASSSALVCRAVLHSFRHLHTVYMDTSWNGGYLQIIGFHRIVHEIKPQPAIGDSPWLWKPPYINQHLYPVVLDFVDLPTEALLLSRRELFWRWVLWRRELIGDQWLRIDPILSEDWIWLRHIIITIIGYVHMIIKHTIYLYGNDI